jgi:type I restriction enzyme, R subunit
VPNAIEFILQCDREKEDNTKGRYLQSVLRLSKAFASVGAEREGARQTRPDRVLDRSGRAAETYRRWKPPEMLDAAVRQIVSRAVIADEIVDIFAAAGLKTPDISILSDEFLSEVRRLPQKNLAIEVLRKVLSEEIKTRSKKNLSSPAHSLTCSIARFASTRIAPSMLLIAELMKLCDADEFCQKTSTIDWTEKENVRAKMRSRAAP